MCTKPSTPARNRGRLIPKISSPLLLECSHRWLLRHCNHLNLCNPHIPRPITTSTLPLPVQLLLAQLSLPLWMHPCLWCRSNLAWVHLPNQYNLKWAGCWHRRDRFSHRPGNLIYFQKMTGATSTHYHNVSIPFRLNWDRNHLTLNAIPPKIGLDKSMSSPTTHSLLHHHCLSSYPLSNQESS